MLQVMLMLSMRVKSFFDGSSPKIDRDRCRLLTESKGSTPPAAAGKAAEFDRRADTPGRTLILKLVNDSVSVAGFEWPAATADRTLSAHG
jgi:hypothetical protein